MRVSFAFCCCHYLRKFPHRNESVKFSTSWYLNESVKETRSTKWENPENLPAQKTGLQGKSRQRTEYIYFFKSFKNLFLYMRTRVNRSPELKELFEPLSFSSTTRRKRDILEVNKKKWILYILWLPISYTKENIYHCIYKTRKQVGRGHYITPADVEKNCEYV